MWSVKYAPKTLGEFAGNKTAVEAALKHDWSRPLLVYGGTGTGKSVFAKALANDLGFELTEVGNENIADAVKLSQTASLWGSTRMILVDNADRVGDMKTVGELIKGVGNPVVLLTSDVKSKRLATVKKNCVQLGLRRAHPATLSKFLSSVLEKEGVAAPPSVIENLAKKAGGDFRAALNDLETLAAGRRRINYSDANVLSFRDTKADIYETLSKVYKGEGERLYDVVASTWDLGERPETTLLWIEENMPMVFKDRESIRNAVANLARADRFLGRIKRRQYWGFLRYVNELMTAGVSVHKPEKLSFGRYNFPSYIAVMGRTKTRRALKKRIGWKIGPVVHASGRVVSAQYIPLYRRLLKAGKTSGGDLAEQFGLDEEEVGFISE